MMPVIDYDGQQYEFPEGTPDSDILEFLNANHEPVQRDVPEPLLPEGTTDYIKQNEGYSAKPYKDSRGIATIGYGFNMQDSANRAVAARLGVDLRRPLKTADAEKLFKHSVVAAEDAVRSIDADFDTRPDSVRKALVDMSYNLGAERLGEFTDMFDALKAGNYKQAGHEVMKSLYAGQVPVRARNNAKLLMQAGSAAYQSPSQGIAAYTEGLYEDETGNKFYVDSQGNIGPAKDD